MLYLTSDSEKQTLKLCMYKVTFGKSGHIYVHMNKYTTIDSDC